MNKDFYIFNNGRMRRKNNTFYFIDEEDNKRSLPIHQIENIYVFGAVDFNTSFLQLLSQHNVRIHIKNFKFKLATCAFVNFAVIENTFLYAVVSNFISLLNASLAVRYPNILRGRLFIHCWIFLIV